MRCEDIMKRDIECLRPDETVQSAARKMRDNDIGFLPVCDAAGKVLGTLTDRDITVRVCAENRPIGSTKVMDVMTRQAITSRPSDDITRAEELMARHHKSRMLVCDDSDKLVGIISLSDIAEHDDEHAADTLRAIAERETHP
jgi:CBS domain-containing protein